MPEFFYQLGDIEKGPLSAERLQEQLEAGFIQPDTPVRIDNNPKIYTAGAVVERIRALAIRQPPPLPPAADDAIPDAISDSGIQLTKGMLGRYTMAYECPNCKSRLKSPLSDAGKTDTCPDCRQQFVVPGTELREKMRLQAEQEEADRARQAAQEDAELARRALERREAEDARLRQRAEYEAAQKATGARMQPPPPSHVELLRDLKMEAVKQTQQLDLIRRYVRAFFWIYILIPVIFFLAYIFVHFMYDAGHIRS